MCARHRGEQGLPLLCHGAAVAAPAVPGQVVCTVLCARLYVLAPRVYRRCVPGCMYQHHVCSGVVCRAVPGQAECTGAVFWLRLSGLRVLVPCVRLWLLAHWDRPVCPWCSAWQGPARGHLPLPPLTGTCCQRCHSPMSWLSPPPAASCPGHFVQRSPVEVVLATSTLLALP